MPGKVIIFKAVGVVLQYGLLILLYYFLVRVLRAIYWDLKQTSPPNLINQAVPAAATQERDEMEQARLTVVDAGKVALSQPVYTVGETIAIGRGEMNDIVINDNFISHEHACIARYKHGFWLSDLNSTNGTLLNNRRVAEEVQLTNGDLIRIGAVTFRFER